MYFKNFCCSTILLIQGLFCSQLGEFLLDMHKDFDKNKVYMCILKAYTP